MKNLYIGFVSFITIGKVEFGWLSFKRLSAYYNLFMMSSNLRQYLPSGDELCCSDDTPVDNEDQNFIPNFLLFLIEAIWKTQKDWFFAVDMGVYHTTGVNPRVPVVADGFLSLGVERRKQGKSRRSYVVWEENDIPPMLVLEVVSWTPGDESIRFG
jgi:Uma2 family endonuclease